MASVGQSRETWPSSPPRNVSLAGDAWLKWIVTRLTVVALLALGAVTSHVTETTARVAGLLATTEATAESTSVATAALGAAARNVSNTTALVALLATADTSTRGTAVAVSLGAFTRDVANATATVAGLLLGSYSALSAYWKRKVS